jgi:hypothetical protein
VLLGNGVPDEVVSMVAQINHLKAVKNSPET